MELKHNLSDLRFSKHLTIILKTLCKCSQYSRPQEREECRHTWCTLNFELATTFKNKMQDESVAALTSCCHPRMKWHPVVWRGTSHPRPERRERQTDRTSYHHAHSVWSIIHSPPCKHEINLTSFSLSLNNKRNPIPVTDWLCNWVWRWFKEWKECPHEKRLQIQ